MNDFNNKCPSCHSTNINDEDTGYLPLVYVMKPIKCQDCGTKFEFSKQVRLSVPLIIYGLFVLSVFVANLKSQFGSNVTFILFCVFIALSFGNMVYASWKNKFILWSNNNTKRAFINYGSLFSIVILGVVFYATKT